MAALEIIWRGYDGILVRKGPGGEREVVVNGGRRCPVMGREIGQGSRQGLGCKSTGPQWEGTCQAQDVRGGWWLRIRQPVGGENGANWRGGPLCFYKKRKDTSTTAQEPQTPTISPTILPSHIPTAVAFYFLNNKPGTTPLKKTKTTTASTLLRGNEFGLTVTREILFRFSIDGRHFSDNLLTG